MRATLTTRSAVAVASLAIGSAALAAVPASAATPSGITRDQILTAAAGVRSAPPGTIAFGLLGSGPGFGPAANRAIRAMVNRLCVTDPDGPEISVAAFAAAPAGGASADGVVVTAYLLNSEGPTSSARLCTFGALAPVATSSVLTGTATLTGAPTSTLSGDAFTTPTVSTVLSSGSSTPSPSAFTATGNAVQSVTVKVADKKTSKQKKAAKKKYESRVKSAKKSYKKALAKAGSSRSKKSAAKKAYRARLSSAKATYRYGIASYKLKTVKVAAPFNVSAQTVLSGP